MRINLLITAQRQHRENKRLQETDEQAEHYPKLGYDPGRQLIQYDQQDFACQDVAEKTKGHGHRLCQFIQQMQGKERRARADKMLEEAQTVRRHTDEIHTDGHCQGQGKAGVDIVGGRSPMDADLRKHSQLIADEDEHEEGDKEG